NDAPTWALWPGRLCSLGYLARGIGWRCRHCIKDVMQDLWCCVGFLYGEGETMLGQDLIVAPTQGRPPALIEGSGPKARDRIEHFLGAAIDNDNTRRAYGRALGSFFAFLDGRARIQDIGPLDVRDYLEAAKANGLSTATLKQHMAAIRMLFNHLVTGAVFEHNPSLSVKAPRQKLGKGKTPHTDRRRGRRPAALHRK